MSKHFSFEELTRTSTGIPNDPDLLVSRNLWVLQLGLEWVRAAIGHKPMIIRSGYRSKDVNIAVGGASNSAHLQGFAADFTVPGMTNREICEKIIQAGVQFDQLIDECSKGGQWVHISFDPQNRQQWLIFSNGKYEVHK